MSSATNILGWREILARVMDGFQCQEDVSPAWLVNPATNRPLKLNQLYPQVGLAIRFVGLTAKGQPRQSDDEAQTEAERDEIRAELCRQNEVHPRHKPSLWDGLTHWVVTFEDETLEVVAESAALVGVFDSSTPEEVLQKVSLSRGEQ